MGYGLTIVFPEGQIEEVSFFMLFWRDGYSRSNFHLLWNRYMLDSATFLHKPTSEPRQERPRWW